MARFHPLLALLLLGCPTALRAQGTTPDPQVIRWWEGESPRWVAWLSSVRWTSRRRATHRASAPGSGTSSPPWHAAWASPKCSRRYPALALAGALAVASKFALGRLRPNQVAEPYDLKPFSGADAFPSGHTTMAFALATSLADELRRPWVTVGLMTAAAGTGWSRVNDNKHWLSDVVASAALGVTAAQLIERRWTVFGWRISVGRADR